MDHLDADDRKFVLMAMEDILYPTEASPDGGSSASTTSGTEEVLHTDSKSQQNVSPKVPPRRYDFRERPKRMNTYKDITSDDMLPDSASDSTHYTRHAPRQRHDDSERKKKTKNHGHVDYNQSHAKSRPHKRRKNHRTMERQHRDGTTQWQLVDEQLSDADDAYGDTHETQPNTACSPDADNGVQCNSDANAHTTVDKSIHSQIRNERVHQYISRYLHTPNDSSSVANAHGSASGDTTSAGADTKLHTGLHSIRASVRKSERITGHIPKTHPSYKAHRNTVNHPRTSDEEWQPGSAADESEDYYDPKQHSILPDNTEEHTSATQHTPHSNGTHPHSKRHTAPEEENGAHTGLPKNTAEKQTQHHPHHNRHSSNTQPHTAAKGVTTAAKPFKTPHAHPGQTRNRATRYIQRTQTPPDGPVTNHLEATVAKKRAGANTTVHDNTDVIALDASRKLSANLTKVYDEMMARAEKIHEHQTRKRKQGAHGHFANATNVQADKQMRSHAYVKGSGSDHVSAGDDRLEHRSDSEEKSGITLDHYERVRERHIARHPSTTNNQHTHNTSIPTRALLSADSHGTHTTTQQPHMTVTAKYLTRSSLRSRKGLYKLSALE